MGIRRGTASYGVDVEATRFPFFGWEDEGTLVIPIVVLGITEWMQGLRVQQQLHVHNSVPPTRPLLV